MESCTETEIYLGTPPKGRLVTVDADLAEELRRFHWSLASNGSITRSYAAVYSKGKITLGQHILGKPAPGFRVEQKIKGDDYRRENLHFVEFKLRSDAVANIYPLGKTGYKVSFSFGGQAYQAKATHQTLAQAKKVLAALRKKAKAEHPGWPASRKGEHRRDGEVQLRPNKPSSGRDKSHADY